MIAGSSRGFQLAPGRAHAKPRRAAGLGLFRFGFDLVGLISLEAFRPVSKWAD
jgi:hypothetical protein